jgi:hypothetical protein
MPDEVTREEWALIRSSVVLPLVLGTVETNRKALGAEKMSIRRLYMIATDIVAGRIKAEIARVKKELWARQIRVVVPNGTETFGYAYVCRGHSYRVMMNKEEVQAEIGEWLDKFMSELRVDLQHA